jgi:hypothetical protein
MMEVSTCGFRALIGVGVDPATVARCRYIAWLSPAPADSQREAQSHYALFLDLVALVLNEQAHAAYYRTSRSSALPLLDNRGTGEEACH